MSTKAPSQQTVNQALKALDGMKEIVRNEMIIQGLYITETVVRPELKGAICGGHQACAIGSVMRAGGISVDDIVIHAPQGNRDSFLRNRSGLRLAIGALNQAAERVAEKRELDLDAPESFCDSIEGLFENHYVGEKAEWGDSSGMIAKGDLLKVINSARKSIEKGNAPMRHINAEEENMRRRSEIVDF